MALSLSLGSCSMRLVDFTVISSKNVNLNIDKTQGKSVEASQGYFLGIGWNIKDAMDKALEEAGPGYDLLVDGVVSYSSYPFFASVKVKGTAMSTSKMKMSMTETEYQEWLAGLNILDPNTAEVVTED
ncbi:MAG: hypothetical protein ABF274_12805 [Nonlabens sp.]|uniref:hypothetical protein n=2 Tax=Nonlabens sp. TaxID=1888209 RepID=UPI00321BEB45